MSTKLCPAIGAVLAAMIVSLSGCEDIDWDWEWRDWNKTHKPIRPNRPPAPRAEAASRPAIRTTTAPEPQAERPQARPWTQTPTAARSTEPQAPPPVRLPENRNYFQLHLINGQASLKAAPNTKKIILEHGRSRAVADMLQLIYPSVGPSGAEEQRFLVYQDEPTWAAATELIPLLDCPDVAQPAAADPSDPTVAIKLGVGLFYQLSKPGQTTNFLGFKRVQRLMEAAMNSSMASGQMRWCAAMLAGRVSAETLSEFTQARKYFDLAIGYALPGSVEEMIATYCQADLYRHEGNRQQAAKLAENLVKKFSAHRESYLYQQAMELAKPR